MIMHNAHVVYIFSYRLLDLYQFNNSISYTVHRLSALKISNVRHQSVAIKCKSDLIACRCFEFVETQTPNVKFERKKNQCCQQYETTN